MSWEGVSIESCVQGPNAQAVAGSCAPEYFACGSQVFREAAARKNLLHLRECCRNVVCTHAERNHLV